MFAHPKLVAKTQRNI